MFEDKLLLLLLVINCDIPLKALFVSENNYEVLINCTKADLSIVLVCKAFNYIKYPISLRPCPNKTQRTTYPLKGFYAPVIDLDVDYYQICICKTKTNSV